MLSAGEAPLAMELVAGPVLPWPGTSETARAPSSSSGVEIPQPMTVEPDPMVRRGLKRASEGDPEIVEICSLISDVNVNEGRILQFSVREFSEEEEWQALSAELARLDEFDAQKDIPRDQATGPLLTLHVDSHGEEWSAKKIGGVCALLVDNQKGARSLFTARRLDHRSTKCCLFWLTVTGGM